MPGKERKLKIFEFLVNKDMGRKEMAR